MAEAALAISSIVAATTQTVSAVQQRSAAKRSIRRERQLESGLAETARKEGLEKEIPKELPQTGDTKIAEAVRNRRRLAQIQARKGSKGSIITGALGDPNFGKNVVTKGLLGG